LSIIDEEGNVNGTIENRVSGFSIHALIGLCAIAASPRNLLAQVPRPVLSGVFLYLGFTSLQGLDMWDRVRGLVKDTLDDRFKPVRRSVVSIYTLVQMLVLAVMMKITQSKYGVVSPLLIAVLPFVRWGLLKAGVVTDEDMDVLDS